MITNKLTMQPSAIQMEVGKKRTESRCKFRKKSWNQKKNKKKRKKNWKRKKSKGLKRINRTILKIPGKMMKTLKIQLMAQITKRVKDRRKEMQEAVKKEKK
ncbi:hypothetical protein TcCL_ESM08837 [Trypanosoma cruzi]|nr:hypothetical protein TcCL_ESM08837 [Trypanosoma cruzi]